MTDQTIDPDAMTRCTACNTFSDGASPRHRNDCPTLREPAGDRLPEWVPPRLDARTASIVAGLIHAQVMRMNKDDRNHVLGLASQMRVALILSGNAGRIALALVTMQADAGHIAFDIHPQAARDSAAEPQTGDRHAEREEGPRAPDDPTAEGREEAQGLLTPRATPQEEAPGAMASGDLRPTGGTPT